LGQSLTSCCPIPLRLLKRLFDLVRPASKGLAFRFRSAEPFGLPSAMSPDRMKLRVEDSRRSLFALNEYTTSIPFRDNCFFHFAPCNSPVAKSVLFICVSNLILTGMGQVSKVRSIEFAQVIIACLSILEHFLRPNIRYLPIKKDNVNISISFKFKHMPFKRIKMQHHTSFQNYLIPFRPKKSARWLANR